MLRLVNNWDGTYFAAVSITWGGDTIGVMMVQEQRQMLVRTWQKLGGLWKMTLERVFFLGHCRPGEDMETFSRDKFEFGKARIVYGNRGDGVRVMDGLGELMV